MTAAQPLNQPKQHAEHCLHCSKPLGALKRILYGAFCSQAHQQEHERQQAQARSATPLIRRKSLALSKPHGPDWEERLEAARRASRQARFREEAVRSTQTH